ncbi:MAG: class 1 isoprenoid biosynthesis enzyme [Saprospiraceae bacterium]
MAYKVFIVNEKKHKPFLFKAVEVLEIKYGEQLPKNYEKRFSLYTKIATLFISWIETLRNQQLTENQKQIALLFCGLTPLFDDLLDEENFSREEIKLLTEKKIQRGTLKEKLCIGLFEEIEKLSGGVNWTNYWHKAIEFQVSSEIQLSQTLPIETLKSITEGKGGYSLLLYLDAILAGKYSEKEANAIFHMGAMIQLTNDIFDIYKDRNEGISTLATTSKDIKHLRRYFLQEAAKNLEQFQQLGYSKLQVRLFLLQYHLILSRGSVALNQLALLQEKDNGIFTLEHYSRKELICDMELWTNIRKSLYYTVTFLKN